MPLENSGADESVQVLGQCSSWWATQGASNLLVVLCAFGELLNNFPVRLCLFVKEIGEDPVKFIEQQRAFAKAQPF